MCELRVDLWPAESLPGHLQIPDELIVLVCACSDLNNFHEVRRTLGLDVRVDRVLDAQAIELSLRQSWPDLWPVDLLRIVEATVDTDNALDEDIDRVRMLLILLEDGKCLFV